MTQVSCSYIIAPAVSYSMSALYLLTERMITLWFYLCFVRKLAQLCYAELYELSADCTCCCGAYCVNLGSMFMQVFVKINSSSRPSFNKERLPGKIRVSYLWTFIQVHTIYCRFHFLLPERWWRICKANGGK